MEVANCRGCGKLFNVIGGYRLCPQCMQSLEDKFQQVKAYIRENPGSSIDRVSQEMDVSVKQLKTWVREERLTFSEESGVGIDCEQCGKMIRTGKYCEECKYKITMNLMNGLDRPNVSNSKKTMSERDRMRFLN